MKFRITMTAIITLLTTALYGIGQRLATPLEASLYAQQVEDSNLSYLAIGSNLLLVISVAIISLLWIFQVKSLITKGDQSEAVIILVLFAMCLIVIILVLFAMCLTGCGCVGPYKQEVMVDIQPNETAYLVPLEGANKTSQASFMSIDYLDANKIAAN